MIPKIIHQYWDGILPDSFKEFGKSFRELNPHFEYYLWNKETVLEKLGDHKLAEHLKACQDATSSSDVARIMLLDHYGGLYFDCDMRPERSIPEFLLNNRCLACYEHEKTLGQTIANGAIGSEQKSYFVKKLIDEIYKMDKSKIKKGTIAWLVFGPRLWTKAFFDIFNNQTITIYPSWYFIPYHYNDNNYEQKKGYITTHIWNNNYAKWEKIIHYTHGDKDKLSIIDRHDEIENLQK